MLQMFRDRYDAGRQLADKLSQYSGKQLVVFAIPRGGVPVGIEVSRKLNAPFGLILPRKLPVPWNPEAGFGAITADGTMVLNDAMVSELGLRQSHIERIAEEIKHEISRQAKAFGVEPDMPDVSGQTVIVIDDGLASGYTMLAALASLRKSNPTEVIVAVPVTSEHAARLIEPVADRMEAIIVSDQLPFAVANYYIYWHDVSDDEVISLLAGNKRVEI